MNEVWKDIEGSDGAYSISNIGRVMSNSTVIRSIYNVIRGRFRQTHGYIFRHKLTI